MEDIKFKYIPGHEKKYWVTEEGEVFSNITNKFLKKILNINGYYRTQIRENGKNKYVFIHRLVAELYLENTENKPCVNHINGIKTDNRVENLQWCSRSENGIHAYRLGLNTNKMSEAIEAQAKAKRKLTYKQAEEIINRLIKGEKQKNLANEFNVSIHVIANIAGKRSYVRYRDAR